jgi:hypothetical protein
MSITSKRILVSVVGWLLILAGVATMWFGVKHGRDTWQLQTDQVEGRRQEGVAICWLGGILSVLSAWATYALDQKLKKKKEPV